MKKDNQAKGRYKLSYISNWLSTSKKHIENVEEGLKRGNKVH